MKCPNCGADIPENKLYCEKCGAELQIVPDFDFDVEKEMKHTMNRIAKEDLDDDFTFDEDPSIFSAFSKIKLKGTSLYILGGVILVLAIVLIVIFGTRISRSNNFDYQIESAEKAIESGNIQEAVDYYESALKIKPERYDVSFTIADYYLELGRVNDSVFILKDVIANDLVPTDKKEEAYIRIINIYEESSNYELIAELLDSCENQNVLNAYARYRASAPVFSVDPGTYGETVALKIEGAPGSTVYYTTDGSEPDENSEVFSSVIFLEFGSYDISAISVNPFGVKSQVVKNRYLIDVDFHFEPDVLTESGTYDHATMIEVDVPVMYTVYYTTDGSDPSKDSYTSVKYSAPFSMPIGESHFKFIEYAGDGSVSDIVERDYNLTLNTEYDPAWAVSHLSDILHESGQINQEDGKYDLIYVGPYVVPDMGDFYFIVEYLTDNSGRMTKTGTFAVDCYNGMVYSVEERGAADYKLTPYN